MKFKSWTILLPAFLVAMLSTGAFSTEVGKDPNQTLKDFEKMKRSMNDTTIRHFTGVIDKDAKNADAYAKRGKAYSGNKEYDKAMADFNKALSLDAKTKDAYIGRAVVYLMRKEYDKCWDDVHQAESLGGEFWPSFMDSLKTNSGRNQ